MSRYVVLNHDWPFPHHDLMLEFQETLFTWRLLVPLHSGEQVVYRVGDHRLIYLDYEGPVSGNRGHVSRLATGNCQFNEREAEYFQVELSGDLQGLMHLQKVQADQQATIIVPSSGISEDAIPWRLVWTPN